MLFHFLTSLFRPVAHLSLLSSLSLLLLCAHVCPRVLEILMCFCVVIMTVDRGLETKKKILFFFYWIAKGNAHGTQTKTVVKGEQLPPPQKK